MRLAVPERPFDSGTVGVIGRDPTERRLPGGGVEATWGPQLVVRSTLASVSAGSPQPAQGRSSSLPWPRGARRRHQS